MRDRRPLQLVDVTSAPPSTAEDEPGRLTEAGAGTHITYTISSTASFALVKAPLAVLCRVLLRMLARASTKKS